MKQNKREIIKKCIYALLGVVSVICLSCGAYSCGVQHGKEEAQQDNTQEIQTKQINERVALDYGSDYFFKQEDTEDVSYGYYTYIINAYDFQFSLYSIFGEYSNNTQTNKYIIVSLFLDDIRVLYYSRIKNIYYDGDNVHYTLSDDTSNTINRNYFDENKDFVIYIYHLWDDLIHENAFRYCDAYYEYPDRTAYKYYLTPYISLNKDINSFYINLGFTYQGVHYYAIKYTYHKDLVFVGQTQNLTFDVKVSREGETYYFELINYVSSITYNQTLLTLISFGSNGLDFCNDFFVNYNDAYLTRSYYIDEVKLFNFIADSNRHNFNLNFKYNGMQYNGYTGQYIPVDDSETQTEYFTFSFYHNGELTKILEWEKPLGEPTNYLVRNTSGRVEFNDSYYNEDTYNFIKGVLSPQSGRVMTDYIPPSVGTAYDNVFTLLGSSFQSIAGLLAISILPGLTIGTLLFIPLVISIVLFVVWLFKR